MAIMNEIWAVDLSCFMNRVSVLVGEWGPNPNSETKSEPQMPVGVPFVLYIEHMGEYWVADGTQRPFPQTKNWLWYVNICIPT